MPEYGVTSEGFNKKSRQQIEDDMKIKARDKFGDDVNIGRRSVLGILIKLISFPLASLWSALEAIYNSSFIDTATGQALFSLGQYIGISRLEGTRAVGEVTFTGDEGTIIEPGFLVETDDPDPLRFETVNDENKQIPSDGTLTVNIRAVEIGDEYNVGPGEITEIVNPISGLDSVTNEVGTAGGADLESEREFRERYKESTDKAGGSTVNSIRATILEETEVSACMVLENTSDSTDDNGLPPKSYEPIVLGGTDQNIGEAIFSVGAAGIESYGDITVTVFDDVGLEKQRSFSRATRVDIYVKVELTTSNEFQDSYLSDIEDNILEYINNLSIGNDVIYSKIISAAYKNIEGVVDVTVYLGTSDPPSGQSNISIGFREVARTDSANIEVIKA